MAFVHYRSPDPRPGHRGESLRTRRVADAWVRIGRFLATCTDDPLPRRAVVRVDAAVDDAEDDAEIEALVASVSGSFGQGAEVRSSSGEERGWEWSIDPQSPARLEEAVDVCARHEARPRIHTNAAVRRHGSPATPQVFATFEYDIALRCGVVDTHAYRPGWGQSRLHAYLGFNEIWLVLHLPFSASGAELEAAVVAIEGALGHTLSRKRLKLYAT